MGWVMMLHENLGVGPPPNKREQFQMLNANHIIKLGSFDTYYPAFIEEDDEIECHSFALPVDANESKMIKWLVDHARIISQMEGSIYIHHHTGRDEEAMLAFVVWSLQQPNQCPKNIQEWLASSNHLLVIDNEEQRRITMAAMSVAKKSTNQGLSKYFKKKPK